MRPGSKDKVKKEFDEILLEVRRVTRVTTGGRKLSFRATILVGNKKGKVGIGVSKGPDVSSAVSKASREAYKNMFVVPITGNQTVPYATTTKYKACVIKLLPATAGTGLKAGSSVRAVLEIAGFENILSKIMGSNNKLNNAIATIQALSAYKYTDHFSKLIVQKGKTSTLEDSTEDKPEQATVVKEILAKQAVGVIPEVVIKKSEEPLKNGKVEPSFENKKLKDDKKTPVKKETVAKKPAKK